MKKHWLTIGLLAALLGLIVIAMVPILRSPSEPEYHGKKLTAWLDDLNAPSASARMNAAVAFRKMGTNAAPFLGQMLHIKDSPFKRKYMELLNRQHWVHFHFHYDFEVRGEALRALALLGPNGRAAIPDVANLLLEDAGDGTQAAYTLSRIGPSAVPALENALTNSNVRARRDAGPALGAVAEPSAVSNLLAALKDPDFLTRSGAVITLRNFPNQANVIVPALTNWLDDPDPVFAGNVARTLGSFGADARPAFPEVLKIVASANNSLSESATVALMEIDFDAALAAFTNNLASPDVNVRRTSAWALMHFKSAGEPAVPGLVKCLKDPDPNVRQNAAVALREIAEDPDVVVPALIANLDDADGKVRVVTAIALGSFGDRAKPAVPKILKIIEENKGNELSEDGLYGALSDIDPAAAAKLNGQ